MCGFDSHSLPPPDLEAAAVEPSLAIPPDDRNAALRRLPSVDQMLRQEAGTQLVASFGRDSTVVALRQAVSEHRQGQAAVVVGTLTMSVVIERAHEILLYRARPMQQVVFNLTGTVLHTNLGRAVLSEAATQAALRAMRRFTNLEFDLETGGRGERDTHVESLICELTGAEAATVVNNNAAAVLLALNTLAPRQEVIVSRGELVEIGGSFRIPEVMASAGSRLREVGATNRTHLHDYESAIGPRTGALMKVHASNYSIEGFTSEVSHKSLGMLAAGKGLPLIVDLGSGALVDLSRYELPREAMPRDAIDAGATAVTFSGDKLLGGPQCGIIVGTKAVIERMRKNPLNRALRVDKIVLAALEATLRHYLQPERLHTDLPTLAFLIRPEAEIAAQAQRLVAPLQAAMEGLCSVTAVSCLSQIGSGSLPVNRLPSAGLSIKPQAVVAPTTASLLATVFRRLPTPVLGRVQHGVLTLDLRCLDDEVAFVEQLPSLRSLSTPIDRPL